MKYSTGVLILCAALSQTAVAEEGAFEREIEARKASFSQIEELSERVEIDLESDNIPWAILEANTTALLDASSSLNGLFPEGSHENSRAKQKIWHSPIEFKRGLTQMNIHFESLKTAVFQKKTDAAERALDQANDMCGSCHRKYRSWW